MKSDSGSAPSAERSTPLVKIDQLGRLQFWLQGHPTPTRGYVDRPAMAWLGNRVSDLRYWTWRGRGGKL